MHHNDLGDDPSPAAAPPQSDNFLEQIEHAIQHDVQAVETWFSHEFAQSDPATDLPHLAPPAAPDIHATPNPASDPATTALLDPVIGNPQQDAQYWHAQEAPKSCAVAAQCFVIEQLTGQTVSEDQLAQLAENNGWYDPDSGTAPEDIGNLLKAYGLNVEQHSNATYDDLASQLAQGHGVIVGVNAEEIIAASHPETASQIPISMQTTIPGQGADHAVEVTGIDRSDPNNPMVILNDPAGTASEAVPLATFMNAWSSSDNYMVDAW